MYQSVRGNCPALPVLFISTEDERGGGGHRGKVRVLLPQRSTRDGSQLLCERKWWELYCLIINPHTHTCKFLDKCAAILCSLGFFLVPCSSVSVFIYASTVCQWRFQSHSTCLQEAGRRNGPERYRKVSLLLYVMMDSFICFGRCTSTPEILSYDRNQMRWCKKTHRCTLEWNLSGGKARSSNAVDAIQSSSQWLLTHNIYEHWSDR